MLLGCGTGAALWRKPWTRRSLLKIVVVLFVADAAVGAANGGHVSRIIIVRVQTAFSSCCGVHGGHARFRCGSY